jgi:hypothetical protein
MPAAGPVLDLSFLIDHVMMDIKPLHWGDVIASDVPLKVRAETREMSKILLRWVCRTGATSFPQTCRARRKDPC